MTGYSTRRWAVGVGWASTAVLVSLACGDSTGTSGDCVDGADATVRLHLVNISNQPDMVATASIQGVTCGPVELPFSSTGGLELAQMVLPGGTGDVITIAAGQFTPTGTSAQCQIRADATLGTGTPPKLQTFVDVTFPPTAVACREGLDPAP
jgi:hypothetical protein